MLRAGRRWHRFNVSPKAKMKARLVGSGDASSKLLSVGLGGCGFVGNRANARLLRSPDVQIELQIETKTFQVRGKVQYCIWLPKGGLDSNLVGIAFDWSNEDLRKEFGLCLGKAVTEGSLEHSRLIAI